MKKSIFILLGFLSLVLAFIGAFLPVLPTTPLIILSAYLFSKGSPRLQAWVMDLPIVGPTVTDWQEHRIISVKGKVWSTIMIVLVLGSTILFANLPHWGLRIMLLTIGVWVLHFIHTKPSHIKASKSSEF